MGGPGQQIHRAGLAEAVAQAADGVVITDASGVIQYVNPAFTAMTGYSSQEAVGKNPSVLKSGRHSEDFYREMWSSIKSGNIWHGRVINQRKDGSLYTEEMRITPVRGAKGEIDSYIAIKHDVTERHAAEESSRFLAAMVESSGDGIFAFSPAGAILTWNRGAEAMLGYTAEEALGQPVSMLVLPERKTDVDLCAAMVLQGNQVPTWQEVALHKDGRQVHVSVAAWPIRNPMGEVTAVSVIVHDDSKRHEAEQSRSLLASIVEFSEDAICSMDLNGTLLSWNRQCELLHGYSSREAIGKSISGFVSKSFLKKLKLRLETIRCGRAVNPFETVMQRKDGSLTDVSIRVSPIRNLSGEVVGASAIFRDITQHKQLDLFAQQTEKKYRNIFDGALEGMFQTTVAGKILTANKALATMLGHDSVEELISSVANTGTDIFVDPQDRQSYVRQLTEHGSVLRFQCRFKRKDGAVIWVSLSSRAITGPDGRPIRFEGFIEDVTERKRAEMQLRESEARYRATFEQAAVGIVHISLEGLYLRCNARFAEIVGYPIEEIPGLSFQQITAPEDLGPSTEFYRKAGTDVAGVLSLEKRYLRKDGSKVWVRLTWSTQRDDQGRILYFIGMVEDIQSRKRAEERLAATIEELRTSEIRYRTVFHTSLDCISVTRLNDGVHIDVNKAFLDVMGYEQDEVLGRSSLELNSWADPAARAGLVETLKQTPTVRNLEVQFRKKNGEVFWGLLSATVIEIEGDSFLLAAFQDVSAARASEEKLRATETRYRTAFQTSQEAVAINRLDDGTYLDVNPAFLETLGYEREDVIGKTSLELNIWADPEDRKKMVEAVRRNSACRDLQVQFRRKNGEAFWGMMSASHMDVGGVPCVLSISRDITDAKVSEEAIWNLAFYDPLTGLPNRRLLLERLQQTLTASVRDGRQLALLFVDVDNFKTLNDTLGHHMGDFLLKEAAHRLKGCVREADTVARFGGDEFVVMVDGLSEAPTEAAAQAESVGEKILAALNRPYELKDRPFRSSASIGITIFGGRRHSIDEILQQADIAMYQAKAAGRNTIRFFAPALQTAVNDRAKMEEELSLGIIEDQFLLHYQPQMHGKVLVGAEALVRWQHPGRGLLAAGAFIPIAEDTGLILPLGNWVLESACRQLAAWAGHKQTAGLSVSVNISARQLHQLNFVEQVLTVLEATGANPERLKLELTESMLVENVEEVIAKMTELKSHRLKFSLDDFGTGYSSLSYLKRLPLDELKIDLSFVRDILVDASSRAIVQTIISLGRAMGLSVIAEGVDTVEKRDLLDSLGCSSFQGYLFSHPVPPEEFRLLLLDEGRLLNA